MTTEATAVDLFSEGSVTIVALKTEYGIGRTTAYELMNQGSSRTHKSAHVG
jgi:hypothetical protein